MRRRSFLKLALFGCVGLLAVHPSASACTCGVGIGFVPVPIPDRVALADAVVIGKVTALEAKNVSAIPFLGTKDTVEYQVAVIQVEAVIRGVKGITHVRVGFQPNAAGVQAQDRLERAAAIPFNGLPAVSSLSVGMEACFFLTAHCAESFFVAPGFQDVVAKANHPSFDKELTLTRQCARLLADPDAGLKSKDAGERFLTAAMLVTRYRTARPTVTQNPKTEPVDVEQSRRIFQALAEADWNNQNPQTLLMPQASFVRLALTDKDGWKIPPQGFKTQQQYIDHVKQWLKANAGTYRLHRFAEES